MQRVFRRRPLRSYPIWYWVFSFGWLGLIIGVTQGLTTGWDVGAIVFACIGGIIAIVGGVGLERRRQRDIRNEPGVH